MRSRLTPKPVHILAAAAAVAASLTLGCSSTVTRNELVPPTTLTAPYDREMLWAVAPPINESGVSVVDTLAIGDSLVAAVTEANGLSCKPMNATIAAMRALNLESIATPQQARALATALAVDGIIISSVTAYDPYNPPVLGLSLALLRTDRNAAWSLDEARNTAVLESAATEVHASEFSTFSSTPDSVAVEHLSGANHEVRLDLKEFALGRHQRASALGWQRYLASIELFTRYAAYRCVGKLLDAERARISASGEVPNKNQSSAIVVPER